MVRPAGVEPATLRLGGECSIHLSYGRYLFYLLFSVFYVLLFLSAHCQTSMLTAWSLENRRTAGRISWRPGSEHSAAAI